MYPLFQIKNFKLNQLHIAPYQLFKILYYLFCCMVLTVHPKKPKLYLNKEKKVTFIPTFEL
ncbi:hypothetical protein WH52_05675 [Tenacibaculum holothuriorum]|uniref:Uncharacterized protein n=1 Tax=Tenacibaculum holothuriorum TaxID=1635173 RepID=A0A1Y2PCS5_9FLAO|nr:hypothetical protein WH52_05675 [Tenacibaculum holothuriorum]